MKEGMGDAGTAWRLKGQHGGEWEGKSAKRLENFTSYGVVAIMVKSSDFIPHKMKSNLSILS